jgi:hypothetical protein
MCEQRSFVASTHGSRQIAHTSPASIKSSLVAMSPALLLAVNHIDAALMKSNPR